MTTLTASAALSIIQAVIKVRGQVDNILTVHRAAEQLPFLLPKVSHRKDAVHRQEMKTFYRGEKGNAWLIASGRSGDFERFLKIEAAGRGPENEMGTRSEELYSIFYEVTGTKPVFAGDNAPVAGTNVDGETLLAYFSVKSARLSESPVAMRLTMTVATTLLEVAGANAGLFVSNPSTRLVVESLVARFVTGLDDDAGVEGILKSLVVSVVATANANPALTGKMPALRPLLQALGDVVAKDAAGKNLVAGLVSADGFSQLLSGYLKHLAADTSLVTDNAALQKVLAATLTALSANPSGLAGDPQAIVEVLGAAVGELARQAPVLLEGKIGGKPLLAEVVTALATAASNSPAPFFQSLQPRLLLPVIYKAALRKIAADPGLIAGNGAHHTLLRELVGDVAAAVAELEPAKVFTTDTLRAIAATGIETLGEHPELLGRSQSAAAGALAAVFKSAAHALKDLRLTPDEISSLARDVIATAGAHPGIAEKDPAFAALLPVFSEALLAGGLKSLLTPASWRAALLAALKAGIAHPAVWKDLRERDLLQPLAQAIVGALAEGNGRLLAGAAFAGTLEALLMTTARRARLLVEKKVSSGDIGSVLRAAAAIADQGAKHGIDLRSLPRFLEVALGKFLQSPFNTNDTTAVAVFVVNIAATFTD